MFTVYQHISFHNLSSRYIYRQIRALEHASVNCYCMYMYVKLPTLHWSEQITNFFSTKCILLVYFLKKKKFHRFLIYSQVKMQIQCVASSYSHCFGGSRLEQTKFNATKDVFMNTSFNFPGHMIFDQKLTSLWVLSKIRNTN